VRGGWVTKKVITGDAIDYNLRNNLRLETRDQLEERAYYRIELEVEIPKRRDEQA
jgi:hypothetical protein